MLPGGGYGLLEVELTGSFEESVTSVVGTLYVPDVGVDSVA